MVRVRGYIRRDGTRVRPHERRAGQTLAGLVVAAAIMALFGPQLYRSATTKPATTTNAALHRVIDGDTIAVTISNQTERVRLLGINTPELDNNECYSQRARRALVRLLSAGRRPGTLSLISDPSQDDRDQYNRLLRYVELDGTDIGAELLRRGAAEATNFQPHVDRHDKYVDLQQAAQSADRGRWKVCGR